MAVKRSDFVTPGRRTKELRWQQEVEYRINAALEHLDAIRELADGTPRPLQLPSLLTLIDLAAAAIAEEYEPKDPAPPQKPFRFADVL